MNPIVHGELSWLTGQKLQTRRDRWLVTIAGLSPDIDGLSLLAGKDAYEEWHHLLTHGIVSAVVFSVILGALANRKLLVGGLSFLAFHLHLVCDLMGSGVEWPLHYLWPFSRVTIGWSGGWELQSWQNSVIGLGVTLVVLACALPFGRTMVELFSLKADAEVVKAIRARFGRRS